MGQATFCNSRGIVHKGSNGISIVFPDVCKTPTPAGPVPIPYPNTGQSSDITSGPTTVTTDGQMPATKDAKYMKSSGDEAGTVGGVVSGVFAQECEFMLYSFDVKMEDKNVARLGDSLWHNKKNMMM